MMYTNFYLLFIYWIVLDLFLLNVQSNQCFNNSYHKINHSMKDQSWNDYLNEVYGNPYLGDQILKSELTMFYRNSNIKVYLIDKNVPKLVRFSKITDSYRILFNNDLHLHNNEWVEVSRFNSLFFSKYFNNQLIEGLSYGIDNNPKTRKKGPWGCWFHPSKGSGIFINVGKVLIRDSIAWNDIIKNYSCANTTSSVTSNSSITSSITGNSSITVRDCSFKITGCTYTLAGGYDSYQIITPLNNTRHPSQLILCSDKCSTTPFVNTCPFDIKLRSGYHAMKSCNCSDSSPLLNCGLHLDKGQMFDNNYSPIYGVDNNNSNNQNNSNNNNSNNNNSLSHLSPVVQKYRPILCISRNRSEDSSYPPLNHHSAAVSIGFSHGLTNKSIEMTRYINTIVTNELNLKDNLLILMDINVASDFRKFRFSIAIVDDEQHLMSANCTILRFDDEDRSNDNLYRIRTSNQFINLINLKSPLNTIILEYQTLALLTINIGIVVFKPNRPLSNNTTTTHSVYHWKDLGREIQDKCVCLYEINVNFIILIILESYNPIFHNSLLYSLTNYINMAVFISKDYYYYETHHSKMSDSEDCLHHQLQQNKLPPILVTKYNSTNYDIVSIFRNNDVYKLRHDSIKL